MLRRHKAGANVVLEYGCGGSTLEFVRSSAKRIVSVDSDANWIAKLKVHAEIAGAESDGRLVFRHVDIGPVGEWGRPADGSARHRWPLYTITPWEDLRNDQPDFVLVDGRFRVASILWTILCCDRQTLMLVHDFLDRPRYHVVQPFCEVVECVDKLAVLRPHKDFSTVELMQLLRPALYDWE
jgi:hypothetical protein